MSSHPSAEMLALYAGEDLDPREAAEIQAHVAGCARCGETVADLESVRELFAGAVPEPDPGEVAAVRRDLYSSIERLERKRWQWRFSAAAMVAATAVLVVVLHVTRPAAVVSQPPVAVEAVRLPGPRVPSVELRLEPVKMRQPRQRAGIREATLIERADAPPELRLSTNDPDVVILLPLKDRSENP